ncbi:hypothetical protein COK29_30060, partial [Bacillus cereus]|uniref:hypothetical protein n=1 Tax=Bacillus cereus TaxID=1396 RepID=UPI000C003996
DGELQKVGDYNNDTPNQDTSFEFTIPYNHVEKGMDYDINVFIVNEDNLKSNIETIKIRPTLNITEKVFDVNGDEVNEIAPGETLSYEISVDSGYIAKDKGTYDFATIATKHDNHLEAPTDFKVRDENGNEIGTAYNSGNTIVADLNEDIPRSKKVKFTYNAKVKGNSPEGEFVVSKATVSGDYSTGDHISKTSNEVKVEILAGVLEFVSAPRVIDFGNKLAISSQHKTYYPINLD